VSAPKHRAGPDGAPVCDEDALLARLADVLAGGASEAPPLVAGELSIGDDAAVLAAPSGHLVLSVDTAVGGIHADLTVSTLEDLGFKALTAAVSDLAAMGAEPRHALVALCVPPGPDTPETVTRLAQGAAEASRAWACPVVGGDLTTAGEVVVSVTVVGAVDAGVGSPRGPLTRAGAAPGDALVVTGPLGAAAAGLRLLRTRSRQGSVSGGDEAPDEAAAIAAHRRPAARLAEGREARLAGASAGMDLSDGLGLDLHRLANASGVGVVVDAVPMAPTATREEALGGGDDYELLLATPDPDGLRAAFAAAGLRTPIVIGRCVGDVTVRTLDGAPLEPTGWQLDLGH
jgi:thiamine-monophosphate kinase